MRNIMILILGVFLLGGCGKKENKPDTDDPKSVIPPVVQLPELKPVPLALDTTIAVPKFKGEVPNIYNDITYISLNKQLMVSNSVGLGEFPLRADGMVNFSKAFTAPCKDCHMRGFTEIGSGLVTALLWERKVLSVSESRKKTIDYKLPPEVTDASGLARLGKHYLVADRASKTVFHLELVPTSKTAKIVKRFTAAGTGVEGVTVRERKIWTTDGTSLFEYEEGIAIRQFDLPAPVAGFCFAGRYAYAAGKDKAEIYRYLSPEKK